MTYRGKVKDGVIVLEGDVQLPEGASVQVVEVSPREPAEASPPQPSWADVFKDVAGKAVGLPSDASRNHDHYLYGTPKRDQ